MARSLSRTTTDHGEIRRWVEERGGQPAEVEGTERGQDDTGVIRLDFPGYAGTPPLRHISWDEWFEKFDASGLALVYQETTARGQQSSFNKLVARETAAARQRGASHASRRSPRGRGRGAGSRRAAASKAGRASAAARRRKGTGRTRRTAGRMTTRGEGQGRRKAPRASAARLTGRTTAKGRRTGRAATKRAASGGRSGGGAARRGGRRPSSRSRSR